jgi:hypothetical protein
VKNCPFSRKEIILHFLSPYFEQNVISSHHAILAYYIRTLFFGFRSTSVSGGQQQQQLLLQQQQQPLLQQQSQQQLPVLPQQAIPTIPGLFFLIGTSR